MKNKYFPFFVDLSEKQVVVIGAGSIASRRVRTLLSFADHITVVSPEATEEIAGLAAEGKIRWIKENYSRERLADAD
ncbi:MAG: precorrin-2 dehydrogenase/sirohydrochlorin ferrochelatase family protein, partial [Bilifractor porci]